MASLLLDDNVAGKRWLVRPERHISCFIHDATPSNMVERDMRKSQPCQGETGDRRLEPRAFLKETGYLWNRWKKSGVSRGFAGFLGY